jgi:8-oxo-dGTP pyrophosphatase MutT (NUDIX family)
VSAKGPSAVVLVCRGPMVLALTRGLDWHDWHLPGGKWEPVDGEAGNVNDDGSLAMGANLRRTAVRELQEETGLTIEPVGLLPLTGFVSRSGRPVFAYEASFHEAALPDRFAATEAGQPAWVPPAMVLQPWCSFSDECRRVFDAAGVRP